MKKLRGKWVFEPILPFEKPDTKFGLRVKKILYSGRSPFQKIQVFDTFAFGKALALDGIFQTTEKDEFIYHEMIAHLPMFYHQNPKKVLIVGGGDGGALEEILKHSIEKVWLVEIDKKVIEICQKYLPSISKGAFKDKKAEIIIGDGWQFVRQYKNFFDVIILDLSDPLGPAKNLISLKFYKDIKSALKSKGVVSIQSGSLTDQERLIALIYKRLKKIFRSVKMHRACIPSYHAGEYTFTIAANFNLAKVNFEKLRKRANKLNCNFQYWSPEIHYYSGILPAYLMERLKRRE